MRHVSRLSRLLKWILSIGLLFLLVFTLMRWVVYLTFSKQGFSFSQLGGAFFLGLRYDLRSVSIVMLVMLLLGSLPFLHPFKTRGGRIFWFTLLSVLSLFILFFFFVDFAHYAYLSQRLNASVLNYLQDAGISMNMVWQSYPVIRIVAGLIIAVLIVMALIRWSYRRISRQTAAGPGRRSRVIAAVSLFLVAGFFIFGQFNQYPLRWSDAFALGGDYKANLALNPFESFFNTLRFRRTTYDVQKVREAKKVLAPYYQLDPQDTSLYFGRTIVGADSVTQRPNVVVVICESFSAYKSSMWGNPLNTTPFFDSLCRNGLFFDRCFTPSYGTARGVWATLTGIPDVEVPTTASRNPTAVDQHTIMNDFTQYQKFYFLGGSTSWANIRGVLTNNISDLHLYEQDDYKAAKIDVWGISDKNLFLEANKVLATQTSPFIAVIQTADNHRPYTIPEEDRQAFKTIDMPVDSLKKYGFETLPEMNAFRFTDYCYQQFIHAASRENYFRNTIFVFVGDHGIPGDAGNMFPRAWTDQRLTSEHVPLLFYAPGRIQPKRSGAICSQVDVLPTAAGLCNISYTNTTLGRNLLDSVTQPLAFIFDPDASLIGVVKDQYFYRKQIKTQKEELVSIIDNQPIPNDAATQATKKELGRLSDALHETARYLLLNNKKKTAFAH